MHSVFFPELADYAVDQQFAVLHGATRELPCVGLVAGRRSSPGEEEARRGPGDHGADAYTDVITARYRHQVIRGMMNDSPRIQIRTVTVTTNRTMYVSYQR